MADPMQYRECEDRQGNLLGEQALPARLARSPVCVFLRGLEGFNTERANDCLLRLLEKHYDTIDVLKLASKNDLVGDAGILPGDALRIVAAVKDYVAPRESSSEVASYRDQASEPMLGVEHRQDSYRPSPLRETTDMSTSTVASQSSPLAYSLQPVQPPKVVNQGAASQLEAVKEGKVVNQIAPKQETVKVAKAPPLPTPRGAFGDGKLACSPADARFVATDSTLPHPWRALVDGKTGFYYYWNPVMNLTQFSKPLPAVGSGSGFPSDPPPPGRPPPPLTSTPNSASPQTNPVPILYPRVCRLCNAPCASEDHFRTHLNGQRHSTAVKEALSAAQAVDQATREAKVAAKEAKAAEPPVVWELKKSLQSQQGASGSKQPSSSVPVDEALHACGVCSVWCGSEIVLRDHFNGKKHAKKMKQAADTRDNAHTPFLYCSICDVSCASKINLVMHFNGKRHANNMKEDSDSGNCSYFSDSEYE